MGVCVSLPSRKSGRSAAKLSGKAKSSSARGKPGAASPLLESPPPTTDDLHTDTAHPPPAPTPLTHLPPPTEDTPPSPKVDPNDEARKKFVKRAMALLDDCKEFLDTYSDLQLNSVSVKQLVARSNILLEQITECLDLSNDHSGLEDLFSEVHRWKRIINTFVVSMLGKYEDPATVAAKAPAPLPTLVQRDRQDASPNTLNLVRRDVVFFMGQLNDDSMVDVGQGADITNSKL